MESGVAPSPTYGEIIRTIVKMGADGAAIERENDVLYVKYYRSAGCGRIYKCVCSYLLNKFQDLEIKILESNSRNGVCLKARVREPGGTYFTRTSVLAEKAYLG